MSGGAFEQAFGAAASKQASRHQVKQILTGVAIEVGETSCTVERDNAPTLFDVRLNAIDDDLNSCVTVYPTEGSEVLVAIIENMKTEAVVIKCSEVQRVKTRIGEMLIDLDKNGLRVGKETDAMRDVLTDLIAEIQMVVS